MFLHNFIYTFKVLIRDRALIFWTIFWPLILGTMFYLAFSNIGEAEKLSTINLGVINDESYLEDQALVTTLNQLSDKDSDNYMFDISYGDLDKQKQLLEDKEIDGYIYFDNNDDVKIIVKENGINQTIIKYVIDQAFEYERLTTDIINYNVENAMSSGNGVDINKIYSDVIQKLNSDKEYTNNISKQNMDFMVIEFYTLIAMTCLFGAMMTTSVISNYLANINRKGARLTLAPVNRLSLLLGGLLATFIVQIFAIGIILFYTNVILGVDYGNRFDLIVLLSFAGCLAGNSLGLAAGSMTFKSDNTRQGIVMAVTMLGCFFSGMMGVTMKYVIDKNIPFINIVNPASMITDGFYSLYYYDTLNRFYFDIMSLIIFSSILLVISCFLMRRKKYDSI